MAVGEFEGEIVVSRRMGARPQPLLYGGPFPRLSVKRQVARLSLSIPTGIIHRRQLQMTVFATNKQLVDVLVEYQSFPEGHQDQSQWR